MALAGVHATGPRSTYPIYSLRRAAFLAMRPKAAVLLNAVKRNSSKGNQPSLLRSVYREVAWTPEPPKRRHEPTDVTCVNTRVIGRASRAQPWPSPSAGRQVSDRNRLPPIGAAAAADRTATPKWRCVGGGVRSGTDSHQRSRGPRENPDGYGHRFAVVRGDSDPRLDLAIPRPSVGNTNRPEPEVAQKG